MKRTILTVTTKDIAKISGYSLGTVDRAINNRPGINRQTKEKILTIAKERGYIPDMRGRSLVSGKTMAIGVVVFDMGVRFFSQLVFAMQSEVKKQGYMLYVIYTQKGKKEEKQALTQLKSLNVDGIILLPIDEGKQFDLFLKRLHIPLIMIGNKVKEWPFVGFKSYEVIRESVYYIMSKGYHQVIYVSPPLSLKGKLNIYEVKERLRGYQQAVKEINELDHPIVIGKKEFQKELDEFSFENSEKIAILCSSDIFALEVMEYLRQRKIRIPDQVGVMGVDNIDILKYIHPRLTTIDLNLDGFGIQAVNYLIKHIENGDDLHQEVYIECNIVEGNTI